MATQNITTDKDVFSYEYHPTTNQNGSPNLTVRGYTNYRRRAYVGFSISSCPSSSVITSVELYLYTNRHDTALTGRFNRITESWTETGLTWNYDPECSSTNQVTHALGATEDAWHSYDITEIYKDAKNAGDRLGVRIMDHNEGGDTDDQFDARESGNAAYLHITYTVVYDDYYIKTTGDDSKDGGSWANAWKTINKAATTVADGTTVHIGFGTYDAEPAGNKIAPQNIGTTGIYYLPETANTGGGTGTVSIEQNA
jgi:hypothetical protein